MKSETKLTRIGILLGALVPVVATLLDLYWNDLPFSFRSVIPLYRQDLMLWIILTTPIAIGVVFNYFAKQVKAHEEELIRDRNNNHDELNKLESFIFDVEKGDFNERQYQFSDPRVGGLLTSLKEKLIRQKQEDENARWVAEGHARFGEIFRGAENINSLADEVIKNLVKISSLNQGSVFILSAAAQSHGLELRACYAYDRKKYQTKIVEPGEGLVGQCFLEKETIVLTQVPPDYVKITSGLGLATPRFIIIVPIKSNDKVEGVIELAGFHPIPDSRIKFIEKVCEGFAAVIHSVRVNEETRTLLESTQQQAEELRSQEEEMRQSIEELHTTQEAMNRKTKESEINSRMLDSVFDSAEDAIIVFSEKGIIERVNKASITLFGYSTQEMEGANVSMLIPNQHHNQHDEYLTTYILTGKKRIIGQAPVAEGKRKNGSLFPIELAVNEAIVGDRKIFTGIVCDITDRVQAERDKQEQMEQLRVQEQQMRQNMEELQAIQEQLGLQLEETRKMQSLAEMRETVLGLTTILSETDPRGIITHVNNKFCEVSKYTSAELVGKPQNIVRHPDMPKALFKKFWETINGGEVFQGIIKNKAKDGTAYWVDATIVPIKNSTGEIIKFIGARYHIRDERMAIKLYNEQALLNHWPIIEMVYAEQEA